MIWREQERLWLLFMDGRCVGIWGLLDMEDDGEGGMKVNM